MFTDMKSLYLDAGDECSGLARFMNDDARSPNAKAVMYKDASKF